MLDGISGQSVSTILTKQPENTTAAGRLREMQPLLGGAAGAESNAAPAL
jgi:hypothetical protein